jgi:hypothetical protein
MQDEMAIDVEGAHLPPGVFALSRVYRLDRSGSLNRLE